MGDYRRLEAWQLAAQLALEVNRLTRAFPAHERFGLTSQLRRAAISISSNIAEGSGRGSPAEFRRFIVIARGSLHEVASQLFIAHKLGFLPYVDWQRANQHIDRISRMLLALTRQS